MNLCKNCMYYKKNADNVEASECTRKPAFSPISGNLLPTYCNLERAAWGTCKPEGAHFKPREAIMTESELDHEWARRMNAGEYDYDIFCRRLVAGS